MGSELSQDQTWVRHSMPDSHPRGIAIRADKTCYPVRVAAPHAIVYRCSAPEKVFFTQSL
ncbi:hypothetical protein PQO01_09425 [Lentisphaera marina]|uniref:hypothetical protein n=1 Tax=Lentisphaera marina TaxID=1111041 RepID=UPI0023657BCF|nr:hypothetical protein [Lentisphaera marina]MDD7985169.1 hypothetical protein [Lentisphaera marina]